MGTPSMQGNPAASAAQHGRDKEFPAGTAPGSIAQVSGLPDATPSAVGSPVRPEIRQVTPPSDMGMGYHQAGEDDAY